MVTSPERKMALSAGPRSLTWLGLSRRSNTSAHGPRASTSERYSASSWASSAGRLANAIGAGGVGGHNGGPQVVLGRSSYHRPECRLAQGKDLPVSTLDAAEAEGLSACRICQPDELERV